MEVKTTQKEWPRLGSWCGVTSDSLCGGDTIHHGNEGKELHPSAVISAMQAELMHRRRVYGDEIELDQPRIRRARDKSLRFRLYEIRTLKKSVSKHQLVTSEDVW